MWRVGANKQAFRAIMLQGSPCNKAVGTVTGSALVWPMNWKSLRWLHHMLVINPTIFSGIPQLAKGMQSQMRVSTVESQTISKTCKILTSISIIECIMQSCVATSLSNGWMDSCRRWTAESCLIRLEARNLQKTEVTLMGLKAEISQALALEWKPLGLGRCTWHHVRGQHAACSMCW